jgi:hypothetical protein
MGKALLGRRPNERPAGEAKPNVCAISDGEAGAYCTVGLVLSRQIWTELGKNINL